MIDTGNLLEKNDRYRLMIGEPISKGYYLDLNMPMSNVEGCMIDCNAKFVAASWNCLKGKDKREGCIRVMPMTKTETIRSAQTCPLIYAHTKVATNIKFSPFNDNLLCSCGDDGAIRFWGIPNESVVQDITHELACYQGHTKKAILADFHPCCSEIVASGSFDKTVQAWNINNLTSFCNITLPDYATDIHWWFDGSILCASDKTKGYLIDPRARKIVLQTPNFDGKKNSKINPISDNCFIMTTSNKKNSHDIKMFDIRNISQPTFLSEIDMKAIYKYTYFDEANKVFMAAAKNENNFYIYDVTFDTLKPLMTYKSKTHSMFRGVPKKLCNYKTLEVEKMMSVCDKQICFDHLIIRKNNMAFDANLYPPVYTGNESINFNSWIAGQNAPPVFRMINELGYC